MNEKLARFIRDSYSMGSATAIKVASFDSEGFIDPRAVYMLRQPRPTPVPNDPRIITAPIDYFSPQSSRLKEKIIGHATNEGNSILSQVMGTPVRNPMPSVNSANSSSATPSPVNNPGSGESTNEVANPATSLLDTKFNAGTALGATAVLGGGYALYKYLQRKKMEKQLLEQQAMEEYRKNMSFGDKAIEMLGSIDPSTIQAAIGAYKAISGNDQGQMYNGGQYYA